MYIINVHFLYFSVINFLCDVIDDVIDVYKNVSLNKCIFVYQNLWNQKSGRRTAQT